MRLALVATSLRLAGAEKQFAYAAQTLSSKGLDVRVYHLGEEDHFQRRLREAGIPVRQIFGPGRPLAMLARLGLELLRFRPHLVQASQFGDLVFASPAGRICGALVLGGVRSDGFYELRTSGKRRRMLLHGAHGLVANSHRAKANLVSEGVAAQKIAVVPNVIDLSEFDRQAARPIRAGASEGRIQVAAVGSLQECKRFDRFLEAIALARQIEPAIFGVIAGQDLGARPALEAKAKDLELLPGHVEFLGEFERIPALLKRSRLLVLTSEYEGFPNVILEAMAARLPVVTTPAGDAEVIVQHGVTGFVVRAQDVRGMADAIVRLTREPRLCAQMGEAGRTRVEAQYNLTVLPERLLAVFSDFARQQGRSSLMRLLEERACAPCQAGSFRWAKQQNCV